MNLKNLLLTSFTLLSVLASCSDKTQTTLLPEQSENTKSLLMSAGSWENKSGSGEVSALSTAQPDKLSNSGGQTVGNLIRFQEFAPKLFRGSQPDENDFATLKNKYGVKTIISFRGDAPVEYKEDLQVKEEKKVVEKLGMKFVNIPVPTNAEIPSAMLSTYFKTLENKANQPAYIHCFHGRDRTGTMAELYKIRNMGITSKQALDDMSKFGFVPKDYPFFAKLLSSSTQASLKKL
ncbi:MAG: tyrosine-protein phosphatase [Candidatus Sericytochromatia bacterium]